jgi:hypothetical protein
MGIQANRHAPHSDISNPPKTHVRCHHCGGPVRVQHVKPDHQCTQHCHPHGADHDYRMEQMPPLVRYFDDAMNEMCKDCFLKPAENRPRHGVRR